MEEKLNFVFFGTPDAAEKTLEILKESGYVPSLVVTSTDKPKGRKMLVTPPPVKIWAEQNKIPYIQPEKLDTEETRAIFESKNNSGFDVFLVVAYGKMIPDDILAIPRLGAINIHYSLLPKYRGASPVESAILNGDTETGVTIQKITSKMDAGNILAQEKTDIFPNEKAEDLRRRLIKIGGELLIKILPDFVDGKIKEIIQNESQATYCKKIKKEDGLIDLNDDPIKNYNKFRAYAHWPRTFFFNKNKRIIITDAVLEDNPFDGNHSKQFRIKKVLPEGKKEITWNDFLKTNI